MAEPLLLLPGMMCDARLYAPQIAAMSAGWAVQVAPLIGADTMAGLAARVLADAPPRFALAGLSMGGILAMQIVATAPDRVTRLALMDTNPNAETPGVAARRGPQIDRVAAGGLEAVMRDELMPYYTADGPDRAAILDLCMDMAMAMGPETFLAQSRALRDRPDHCDTLRGVRVPTLVLCGADDRLCPRARHDEMHALVPGSVLCVVPGAGHLPTLEQPAAVTAALAAWLDA